nr:unnamed protein product [Callosobruchus analis]
MGISSTQG